MKMNSDEWYHISRLENRLPKDIINQKHISIVSSMQELILIENCKDHNNNPILIEINLKDYLSNFNFQDYIIYKYGNSNHIKEESIYKGIKGHEFKNKKCDISFIFINKINYEVFFFLGEIKNSLTIEQFFKARTQIISTLIDLHIINSIVNFSHPPQKIDCIIFTKSESKIPSFKNSSSINLRLYKDSKGKSLPLKLILSENENKLILCSIDKRKEMDEFDENIYQNFNLKMLNSLSFEIKIV